MMTCLQRVKPIWRKVFFFIAHQPYSSATQIVSESKTTWMKWYPSREETWSISSQVRNISASSMPCNLMALLGQMDPIGMFYSISTALNWKPMLRWIDIRKWITFLVVGPSVAKTTCTKPYWEWRENTLSISILCLRRIFFQVTSTGLR